MRPPRRLHSLHECVQIGVGVAFSALGLALTVSVLAVMYADASVDPAPDETMAAWSPEAPSIVAAVLPSPQLPLAVAAPSAGGQAAPVRAPSAQPASGAITPPGDVTDRGALAVLQEVVTTRSTIASKLEEADRVLALGVSSAAPAAPAPSAAPLPVATPTPEARPTERPAAAPPAAPVIERVHQGVPVLKRIANANLTFYDCLKQGFCGNMANGRKVYEGAAACSYDMPLGTRFYIETDPTGRIYRCEDRGLLATTWVDIFFYNPEDGWRWQAAVGRYGAIDIVEWGPGR